MSERALGANRRRPVTARTVLRAVKAVFGSVGRLLATVIMVSIITGCIVASVLTVYVLQYIGAEDEINLDTVRLGYTSIIYNYNEAGEPEVLQRLYIGGEDRVWRSYDEITENTKNAIVAIEDKRFWEHNGVDWKRSAGAFVNLFIPIYDTQEGGSTITQQLIKNLTDDDEFRIERKIREIFRALNLSQRYSPEQILEAYLNVVPFGNGTNGIQAAAETYFGKNASELTLAESASIVGITQKPTAYNPFLNPENNKKRQEHVLFEMLDQGYITQREYEDAKNEPLRFKQAEYQEEIDATQNWFVDHVIETVIEDLMEQKGYTKTYATEQLYQGGYRIYTTVDMDIQNYLEDFYKNTDQFPAVYNEEYPQSACVITDPNGKLLALVGGIGEKTGARMFNRASMAKRQPGSSIKPLAAYALSFEYDDITWSTMVEDSPITLEEPGKAPKSWPTNYYSGYDGLMTVDIAIQRSTNTIPVKLVQYLTPQRVFDFLKNDLQMDSLVEREVVNGAVKSDINLSSMALGGMTYGVTPMEMAGGYQIYANGGYFTKPYCYTEVRDADGKLILQADTTARRVISQETSVVVNKLLQRVVTGPRGTGVQANLGNMPTAGKTGTSTDDNDQWFIGITPYYVCQVWLGYDVNQRIRYGTYGPPVLWKSIMAPLHEGLEYASFPESDGVVARTYCTISGDLATDKCGSTGSGWYKTSNIPGNCIGHAVAEDSVAVDPDDDGGTDFGVEVDGGSGDGGTAVRGEFDLDFGRFNKSR